MNDKSTTTSYENFCPRCLHYQEQTSVCKKFYFNVRDYPKKYANKCNSNYFEQDPNKTVYESLEIEHVNKDEGKPSENAKSTGSKMCGNCGGPQRNILIRGKGTNKQICLKCNPPAGTCPNCGDKLRTERAQQCPHCQASWHLRQPEQRPKKPVRRKVEKTNKQKEHKEKNGDYKTRVTSKMNNMKNSYYGYSQIGGSEILLAAASPGTYRINAFRISGLPVDATTRDISKQVEKFEMSKKYGGNSQNPNAALPLDPPPDEDAIREAMQRLRDPERRMVDELFWFWPHQLGQSQNDEALKALAANDIKKANATWAKLESMSSEANVSMHNLAVLSHLLALDLEYNGQTNNLSEKDINERNRLWNEAFKRWRILLEHEGFWSRFTARIRQLDDPRLTTGTARRIRESSPLALLLINAYLAVRAAEANDIEDIQRHLNIMAESRFDEAIINEALRRTVEPIRKRIKTLCKSAKEDDDEPEKAFQNAAQLIDQTAPLFSVLDAVLLTDHPTREGAHDEVALTVLTNVIFYGNETENNKQALGLLQKVHKFAVSESAGERIQKNIDTFKSNIEYDLEFRTCFFCKENQSNDDSAVDVQMHGNVQQHYTKITWKYLTIKVPRCETCKEAHDRIDNFSGIGGLLGGLVGLGGCIKITSDSGAWFGGLIVMGIGAAIGAWIGYLIAKGKNPPDIESESHKTNFSRVRELLDQGWDFGERPAEANQ